MKVDFRFVFLVSDQFLDNKLLEISKTIIIIV